jgi:DNA-binding NtrC family response regulator
LRKIKKAYGTSSSLYLRRKVVTASSVEKATKLIRENDFDLILTDICMGRSNGIDFLDATRHVLPDTPVVMMIAYALAETSMTAIKEGTYRYTSNPFKTEDIKRIVKRAFEKRKLSSENWYLKTFMNDRF